MYFRSHSRLAKDEEDYGTSVVFTMAAPKKFNDEIELPNVPLGGFYDVVLTNRFILENGEANLSFGTGDITQTDVQLEFKLKTDFEVNE